MSDEISNATIETEEVDNVVDEAFSFIYDEACDLYTSDSSSALEQEDGSGSLDKIETILADHFSFLADADESGRYELQDVAGQPIYSNIKASSQSDDLSEISASKGIGAIAMNTAHCEQPYKQLSFENVSKDASISKNNDNIGTGPCGENGVVLNNKTVINIGVLDTVKNGCSGVYIADSAVSCDSPVTPFNCTPAVPTTADNEPCASQDCVAGQTNCALLLADSIATPILNSNGKAHKSAQLFRSFSSPAPPRDPMTATPFATQSSHPPAGTNVNNARSFVSCVSLSQPTYSQAINDIIGEKYDEFITCKTRQDTPTPHTYTTPTEEQLLNVSPCPPPADLKHTLPAVSDKTQPIQSVLDEAFSFLNDPATHFDTIDLSPKTASIVDAKNVFVDRPLEEVSRTTSLEHLEKLRQYDQQVDELLQLPSGPTLQHSSSIASSSDLVEAVNPGVVHAAQQTSLILASNQSNVPAATTELSQSVPYQPILTPILASSSLASQPTASCTEPHSPPDQPPNEDEPSLKASLSRVLRLSMRRMQQFRLSATATKRPVSEAFAYYNDAVVSDEPHLTQDDVTSPPTASAVVLAPPTFQAPREQFPPPPPPTPDHTDVSPPPQRARVAAGRSYDTSSNTAVASTPTPLPTPTCSSPQEDRSEHIASTSTTDRYRARSREARETRRRSSISVENESSETSRSQRVSVSSENLVAPPRLNVNAYYGDSPPTARLRQNVEVNRDPSYHWTDGYITPLREYWPHNLSALMACLPLTLNTFNISRFAVFGAKYGWQFPIQWGLISLVFGLPLMTFQMSVGQLIGAGPVDMWLISPIFQGIGYALLLGEAILGVYCCVPIAWMFTLFRDSFDTRHFRCLTSFDCDNAHNISAEINEVVPYFFTSNILGRGTEEQSTLSSVGSIQFNLTFNLILIWIITFLSLSRGSRSVGKVCYIAFLVPLLCYLAVCCYLIYIAVTQLPMSSFNAKFLDKQSWMAASREAFLVWALHGPALQQLTAGNRKGHALWRDTTVIALLTISGLCLASFCGIVSATVLSTRMLKFVPSSFETEEGREFVEPILSHSADFVEFVDNRLMSESQLHVFAPQDVYDNFYAGIRIRRYSVVDIDSQAHHQSGYNSLRLLTEMFPGVLFTLRIRMAAYIPPLLMLALLMFGLSHQLSLWYAIIQGVMRLNYTRLRPMQTVITFCCCVFGFSAALPMVTGAGMHIVYFMDFIVGSAWWLMILQLIQMFAVLLVRGKPFAAGDLARELFGGTSQNCVLKNACALAWTVVTPVGLVVATISSFQSGDYRQVFTWECADWPVWACQVACAMQLFPLLLVPLVGLARTFVFIVRPSHCLLQKLEYLYRPQPFRDARQPDALSVRALNDVHNYSMRPNFPAAANAQQNTLFHDPPPKYTPPPSYSTATGTSLAKVIRNSLRRSSRYIREASSNVTRSALPI